MSQTTVEMQAWCDRARAGDQSAMQRIKRYLQDHVFELFGREIWTDADRQRVLETDESALDAMQLVIGYIEESGA
jgi:hypothetical protein